MDVQGLLTTGAEGVSDFAFSKLDETMIFHVFLILLMGALGIPMLLRLFGKMIQRSKGLAPIQTYILSSTRIFLWIMVLLMVAEIVDFPVSSIVALLGVAGFAVSLALQNTLSNLAGGLQVLISKPFVVGDFIDTEQGSGKVAEIGLAYSKLSTVDNKEILIPNYLVSASKIVNHTASGVRRVDVIIPVSYDVAIKRVREVVLAETTKIPQIHTEPPPEVFLTEFGESSLQYSVRVWTTAEDYWQVYFLLMELIREAFVAEDIEIPYNHLNVHLHQSTVTTASLSHGESHLPSGTEPRPR